MRNLTLILSGIAVGIFTGCGGGGGGGNAPSPSPSPQLEDSSIINGVNYTQGTASNVDQASIYNFEYINAPYYSHLDKINAGAAYEQGWTGEGVTVGILDSGIDTDHSDLDDNIKSSLSVLDYNQDAINGEDDEGHGTTVAGVIAAEKNNYGMQGVAYNADIVSVKVLDQYGSSDEYILAAGLELATDQNVKVTNISVGGSGTSATEDLANSYRDALLNDNSLVIAAGNEGTQCSYVNGSFTGCNFPAALPEIFNDLKNDYDGAFIVVGSVDENGNMASYSNTAGITQEYFMVAPGGNPETSEYVYTTSNSGTYTFTMGTSLAAPMVTGTFALIAQKYPYLTGVEIRDILFASADDLGETGVDEIYGRGLLNVERAMAPIGTLNIPVGGSVFSQSVNLSSTGASMGSLNFSKQSLSSTIIIDDFNRGYTVDVSSTVTTSTDYYDYDLNEFKILSFNNLILGLNESRQEFGVGYDFESFKCMFSQKDGVFGASGTGATYLSGKTYYGSVMTSYKDFNFNLTTGYSNAKVDGLFKDISSVYGVGYDINYKVDNFTIGVNSPMTVVSGKLDVEIPTSVNSDGSLVSSNFTQNLSNKLDNRLYVQYSYVF